MNSPISSILMHFTGKHLPEQSKGAYLAYLRNIITKGIRFNNPDEILVISPELVRPYLQEIICFTDIPLNMCQELAHRYGRLGFGFRRETIENYGGNPVFYVPNGFITRSKILEALYPILEGHGYTNLLANFKMYGESTDRFCYLMEREWRLIYDDDPKLAEVFVTREGEKRDHPRPTRKILFQNDDYKVTFQEEGTFATFYVKNLKAGTGKPLCLSRQGRQQVRYFRFRPEDLALLALPEFPGFKEEVRNDPELQGFFRADFPPLYYFEEL